MTAAVRLVSALAVAAIVLFVVRPAAADEVAPELEAADLRVKTQAELKRLTSALPPADQKRVNGVYVAFHADASDPLAVAACDDDGDYVVVVSDAMLRLVSNVARAQSYDDAGSGSRKVEDYAGFLARTQLPGRRLLPPPPGFYVAELALATYEDRLREGLAFVVARELTHIRAGQLVCPHPTATKESGDDVWTAAEHRHALELVPLLYPGRAAHDDEATVRVLDAGRLEDGALGLLRFFGQLEAEQRVAISRFAPTYRSLYPQSALRGSAVRAAADGHRSAND